MLQIIDATSRRALEQFLARDRGTDRAFERRVTAIVDRVRAGGDKALLGFARRFDGVRPPLEVSVEEMRAAAAAVPADVRRAIRQAARHIARVAAPPDSQRLGRRGGLRRFGATARRAAGARRVLRAGRPLPAALLAADDRRSGACGRRVRDHRRLSQARAGRDGSCAGGRGHAPLPGRRSPRDCRPGLRHRHDAPRGQDRGTREPVRR